MLSKEEGVKQQVRCGRAMTFDSRIVPKRRNAVPPSHVDPTATDRCITVHGRVIGASAWCDMGRSALGGGGGVGGGDLMP